MSQELREKDLIFHQDRGNHQSAIHHNEIIDNITIGDIHRGYALPLPTDILLKIPNASLAPLGCQVQETIDKFGIEIPKYCMTHDQTFPATMF
jgi:hypothetical protein